jgi:hypothetical protein
LKKELAGYTMTRGEFKKEKEGVLRGAGREEFDIFPFSALY